LLYYFYLFDLFKKILFRYNIRLSILNFILTPKRLGNSFHYDYCKVCGFANYLASWNQIPAPNDVGLVGDGLRLILGDDLSAMINRCLGGTEISKRFKAEERPKLKPFSFASVENEWAWERISYLTAKLERKMIYNRRPHSYKTEFEVILAIKASDEADFNLLIANNRLAIITSFRKNCGDDYV
jgi:hypothetical protein